METHFSCDPLMGVCRHDTNGTYTSLASCSKHCHYIGSDLLDEIQSYIGFPDATIATSTWNHLRLQNWRAQAKKTRRHLIARVIEAMDRLDASVFPVELGRALWVLPEPEDEYLGDFSGHSLTYHQIQEVTNQKKMTQLEGVVCMTHGVDLGVLHGYLNPDFHRRPQPPQRTSCVDLDGSDGEDDFEDDDTSMWVTISDGSRTFLVQDEEAEPMSSSPGATSQNPSFMDALSDAVVRTGQLLLRFNVSDIDDENDTSVARVYLPAWISTIFSDNGVVLKTDSCHETIALGQLSGRGDLELYVEVDIHSSLTKNTLLKRNGSPCESTTQCASLTYDHRRSLSCTPATGILE
jgi:hypothetical protein